MQIEALQHVIKELGHNRNETRRKRGELMVTLKDKEFQLSFENEYLKEVDIVYTCT